MRIVSIKDTFAKRIRKKIVVLLQRNKTMVLRRHKVTELVVMVPGLRPVHHFEHVRTAGPQEAPNQNTGNY